MKNINTCNISNIGTKKAKVFPLPVTASAATSFPFKNRGIQAACIHYAIN